MTFATNLVVFTSGIAVNLHELPRLLQGQKMISFFDGSLSGHRLDVLRFGLIGQLGISSLNSAHDCSWTIDGRVNALRRHRIICMHVLEQIIEATINHVVQTKSLLPYRCTLAVLIATSKLDLFVFTNDTVLVLFGMRETADVCYARSNIGTFVNHVFLRIFRCLDRFLLIRLSRRLILSQFAHICHFLQLH